MVSDGNSTPENFFGNPCRRLGKGQTAVYKIPYDPSATALDLIIQSLGACKLEKSKDGSTWTDLDSFTITDLENRRYEVGDLLTDNEEHAVYLRISYTGPDNDTMIFLWVGLQSTIVYDGKNISLNDGTFVQPDVYTAEDAESGPFRYGPEGLCSGACHQAANRRRNGGGRRYL